MGCRTRVFENRYGEKTSIGRGNMSVLHHQHRATSHRMHEHPGRGRAHRRASSRASTTCLKSQPRQLCDRYDFQKTALVKQFPLLMSRLWNGAENLDSQRDHRERDQPGHTRHRIHRPGRMSRGTHRQTPRRVGGKPRSLVCAS